MSINVAEQLQALRHRGSRLSAWCFVEVPDHVGPWDRDKVLRCLNILSNLADSLTESDASLLAQVSDAIAAMEHATKGNEEFS